MMETGVNLLALGILAIIAVALFGLVALLWRFVWQEWIEFNIWRKGPR